MAIVTGSTNSDTGGGTAGGDTGGPEGAGGSGPAGAPGTPGSAGTGRYRARSVTDAGRIRQPVALIRLFTGLTAIALTLLLADYARATTGGFAADVAEAAALVPRPLASLAGGLTTAAVLLLPVGLAVRRLLGPDRRRALQQVSDGLLAAVLAYGATLAVELWIDGSAPVSLTAALTQRLPGDVLGHTEPVYGYLAPALAFMTASGSRERRVPWTVLALSGLAGLACGYATPTALLLGLLIGWTGAHGTLYAVGTPDPRPRPGEILRALRDSGLRPIEAVPVGPDRYRVQQAEGRPELDVQLLDRQAVTAAAVQRAWRRLRLRTAPHPRALRSPRTGLEHEALVTYAALAAGVRTRRIAATAGLGHDTALIAYERLAGRTLDQLADEEITDELLTDAWHQFALLQGREIAHRALVPSSLLIDDTGAVHLVDFADGDIAASELVLCCDLAQLLTTLALRTGAPRAVRTATAVLGPGPIGAALPLLQPIALTRTTRQSLKRRTAAPIPDPTVPAARSATDANTPRTGVTGGRDARAQTEQPVDGSAAAPAAGEQPAPTPVPTGGPTHEQPPTDRPTPIGEQPPTDRPTPGTDGQPGSGGLLEEIRAEVLRGRPEVVVRPVRLERLRPRTLMAVVGGVVAGWLLIPQLFAAEDNPVAVLADADPWWLVLALVAAGASHVAAAMGFVGFVPERLDFRNAVLAQLAGAFVKLVSPGGVGGIALNTRLLQQANIPTAQALSSVGVGQLIGLVLHLLQLGAFVYLLDVQPGGSELEALPAVVGGLAVAAVLLAVVWAIPPARQWLAARLRPLTAEVLPRLLDLLRNPGRLSVGVAGQLLVSLCLIACLYCCVRAIGREPSFASMAVVFLVGNAAGNAAPTPGGAGAVDTFLVGLMQQTASMEKGGALAAVALFRLLTLILPVLPGWAALAWLRRRKAV
ncbi:lysylphosphatidylglycerol synthase transmembrane domain-containing protein [Kitasatospora sp. SUK 42]|uniref:lysylphosphatidylglycerol synthase transmembrane domain-containing protein n=1 Tax=Kitasatospora sp. SUK 42 TaxID=1588882 RepID=UPI001C3131E3|nr:lysylphosphatidylglycerol synthase transmembrane domain-containing protein [Kitasatospora sp. SUK 42]MBV2154712.1 flippase-like domain-containing protein [Kitasatospora sp. SUK 42]